VVLLRAADLGKTGAETPEALESDAVLRSRVEKLRLALGPKMNLGDVAKKTVPKMTLISPATSGGALNTRSFIPHRVHEAIGVLGAVSVATACVAAGSVAAGLAHTTGKGETRIDIEHPSGFFTVTMQIDEAADGFRVQRSALLRTARKLLRGEVFVPEHLWPRA
jgi:4-oxalomesaconate tautomerase